MRENFGEAHDGEPIEIRQQIHALGLHALATQAQQTTPGPSCLQGSGDTRPVLVTRGLPGKHEDRGRSVAHRALRIGHPGTRSR